MRHLLMAFAFLLLAASGAQAATLDFNNGTNGDLIDQSFGDSLDANISYRSLVPLGTDPNWGNVADGSGGVAHWTTGYSDLTGAAWTPNGNASVGERGEIRIEATDPNKTVTLNGFDLGTWQGTPRNASWYVFDLNGNLLGNDKSIISGLAHWSLDGLMLSALGGIVIQWGDNAWGVALNNINYDLGVSAVPLPAALPLFLTMLAGMGALRWWRNRRAAA